jgi:hypothetical protein
MANAAKPVETMEKPIPVALRSTFLSDSPETPV